jgi:NitT/TauT family transport system substrate-binding protein
LLALAVGIVLVATACGSDDSSDATTAAPATTVAAAATTSAASSVDSTAVDPASTPATSGAPASTSTIADTSPPAEPATVKILMPGTASATVGGYIAAVDSQVAKDENLTIELVWAGAGTFNTIPQLAAGEYDFTLSQTSNALIARSQQLPLVQVYAAHDFPSCAMAHADAGVTTWDDLHGKTVAVAQGATWWTFIQGKFNLQDVTTVAYAGSIAPFLADKNMVTQCYVTNEPFQAQQQGVDVTVLKVADYGFNPYSDSLLTTDSVIADDPDLVGRVVRAVAAGWEEYLADPQPVFDQLEGLGDTATPDAREYAFEQLKGLTKAPYGYADDANVKAVADTLVSVEAIPAETADEYQKVFTNEFLPD